MCSQLQILNKSGRGYIPINFLLVALATLAANGETLMTMLNFEIICIGCEKHSLALKFKTLAVGLI